MKKIRYRFRNPLNTFELNKFFTFREDRGDRVLVTCNLTENLPITPTFVYLKQDLIRV